MLRPRPADRLPALLVMGALAVACALLIAVGVTPARVTAHEILGPPRGPGEAAFVAAHRGGAVTAPENTLPAVRAALEQGLGYVEVDLALTADGHAVLMHDDRVDRTTDGTGPIAELTLAQVRSLDAGSWLSADHAGTSVPTVEEFLDVLAALDGRAILDLKGEWTAPAAAALVDQLAARGLERAVAVASFDARTLAQVQARSLVVSRLIILRRLPADIVQAAVEVGARGILVSGKTLLARPDIVDDVHAAGLRILVYTLNSDRQWDAAVSLGVDGIITDEPALLDSWQRTLARG